MKTYKLYIREYNIVKNDYVVREETVETNDIYHEIGKIYCQSIVEIKRIDYQEINPLQTRWNSLREWISHEWYENGNDIPLDEILDKMNELEGDADGSN